MRTSCKRSVRGQVWMDTKFPVQHNEVKLFCSVAHFSTGYIFTRYCVCIWYTCVHMQHIISSVCTLLFFFCIIGHHIPCQRKSAVYYLVYLDIWHLLFRSGPTQILLIALTNIASPVCHKSKQDTVVAPSVGPNLNVSAVVNSGTENPYVFYV